LIEFAALYMGLTEKQKIRNKLMANAKPVVRETAVPVIGPCLEWQRCRNPKGYGRINVDGKILLAHRLAWQVFEGEIPKGMHVLHRCDNPACCNPAHLFLGTAKDNMRDRDEKGRREPPKGSKHGRAKLNETDIPGIFRLRREGRSQREIAGVFGVTHQLIALVLRRKRWKHVPVPVDLACEVNG
jgi:hypothetical protein